MEGQIKERIQMSTEFEEFVARNNKEISEKAMAKGTAEVRAEIAATLLKEKLLSPEEIERVTGISIDQLCETAAGYSRE